MKTTEWKKLNPTIRSKINNVICKFLESILAGGITVSRNGVRRLVTLIELSPKS